MAEIVIETSAENANFTRLTTPEDFLSRICLENTKSYRRYTVDSFRDIILIK
jgi:hypothetical protein